VLYVDTSALVKLVMAESESKALRAYLEDRGPLVSSALASAALVRATRRAWPELETQAMRILEAIEQFAVDDDVLTRAARLSPPAMRTLDAIHIATALALGPDVEALITYDARMSEGAAAAGLSVEAPG
jgi:predicted nucleic acid-binding protein